MSHGRAYTRWAVGKAAMTPRPIAEEWEMRGGINRASMRLTPDAP